MWLVISTSLANGNVKVITTRATRAEAQRVLCELATNTYCTYSVQYDEDGQLAAYIDERHGPAANAGLI